MTPRARIRGAALIVLATLGGCDIVAGYDRLTLRDSAHVTWSTALTGSGDASVRVLGATSAGTILAAGTFEGDLQLGAATLGTKGTTSAFVALLSREGAVQQLGALESTAVARPLAASGSKLAGIFTGELVTQAGTLATATGDDALFLLDVSATSGAIESARALGGAGFVSPEQKLDLAVDSAGNTLLGGSYGGSLTFSGCAPYPAKTKPNLFLAKLDKAGMCLWSIQNDDGAPQRIESVAVDGLNDFVVVGGEFVGKLEFAGMPVLQNSGGVDLFIARFDAEGTAQWSRSFGNGLAHGGARVAAAPGGYSALVAWFDGTLDFGAGPLVATRGHDLVVANFRPNGQLEWQKQLAIVRPACDLTTCEFDDVRAMFDPEGNLVVSSAFRGSVSIDGVSLGTTDDAAGYLLAKFDRSGHLLWSGHFGDANDDCSERGHCELALTIDAERNVYLGGSFNGALDFSAVDHDGALSNAPLFAEDGRDAFLAKFLR